MGFILRSYDALKEDFDKEVGLLRVQHQAKSVAKLRHPRREQVQFLYAAIAALDNYEFPAAIPAIKPEEERARVLSGLMLNVLYEINPGFMDGDSGSFLGKSLSAVIGISEENKLDYLSGAAMLASALNFFNAIVHENGDYSQSLLIEHPFTNIDPTSKKELFDETAFKNRANRLQKNFIEQHNLIQGATKQKTILDSQPAASGWLGMFGGGSASKEPKSKVDCDAVGSKIHDATTLNGASTSPG